MCLMIVSVIICLITAPLINLAEIVKWIKTITLQLYHKQWRQQAESGINTDDLKASCWVEETLGISLIFSCGWCL